MAIAGGYDKRLAGDGEYVERRPGRTPAAMAALTGRWAARLLVLVLLISLAKLIITSNTIDWPVVRHYLTAASILRGVLRTLELTAIGMAIGVSLGLVLALMRLSKSLVLSTGASLYLWIFRGTPLLVQIIFWYNLSSFVKTISIGIPFGGPTFASWPTNSVITTFVAAIVALGLNQAAYMTEIIRAGIISVDPGQMEAALTLGITRTQAMRRIVLPQAMRVIIPPTGNNAIELLKDSSLVSVISTTELLYSVQLIYANTFQTIPLLVVASIWYLVMTTVTSIGQYYLERHFGRGTTRTAPPTPVQRLVQNLRSRIAGHASGA